MSFKNAKYSWIWLSAFLGLLSHFLRAFRWKYTLGPLGYYPKTYNLFFSVMLSYFANLAFPRLGDVLRCSYLGKYENLSFDKLLGTVIAERAVDLLFLFIAFLLVVILQIQESSLFINIFDSKSQAILTTSLVFFLIGLSIFLIIKMSQKSNNVVLLGLSNFFKNLGKGFKSILIMKEKFTFIFLTIVIWILYFLIFYVCIFALTETSFLNLSGTLTCFLFGAIAITITPGGLGAYPKFISEGMALYGISETIGYASGWIVWTGQTIMIILLGGLSLILFPVLNKKNE